MNPWVELIRLLPARKTLVGAVIAVDVASHTSVVTLTGGGDIRVMGDSVAVGRNVFVEDGRIVSEAPVLPVSDVEIA